MSMNYYIAVRLVRVHASTNVRDERRATTSRKERARGRESEAKRKLRVYGKCRQNAANRYMTIAPPTQVSLSSSQGQILVVGSAYLCRVVSHNVVCASPPTLATN